jgi:hypothetical protein
MYRRWCALRVTNRSLGDPSLYSLDNLADSDIVGVEHRLWICSAARAETVGHQDLVLPIWGGRESSSSKKTVDDNRIS